MTLLLLLSVAAPVAALTWWLWSGSKPSLIVTFTLACLSLAFWLWVSWSLRDGMGPDAIDSSGTEALRRFWSGASIWVMSWAGLVAVALSRLWWGQRTAP